MLYTIKSDDLVFDLPEYNSDRVHFSVLDRNIRMNDPMILMTNGKSVIMGRSNTSLAMWIWTSENIAEDELSELKKALPNILAEGDNPHYTVRDEIADYLKDAFADRPLILEEKLTAYRCDNLKIPEANGLVLYPLEDDIPTLAQYLIEFHQYCFNTTPTYEDMENRAKWYVENSSAFILKNDDGKITALAGYGDSTYGYMKIGPVFTATDERNKRYGAYLTAKVCEYIKQCGCIPILYADSRNPASNKAYQNIGFIDAGRLTTHKFGGK